MTCSTATGACQRCVSFRAAASISALEAYPIQPLGLVDVAVDAVLDLGGRIPGLSNQCLRSRVGGHVLSSMRRMRGRNMASAYLTKWLA